MNRLTTALLLSLTATPLLAAPLPCEQLKDEIEQKIQSAGVASYTLEIVANADASDPNMIVGSCDNGTRKIVYQKNDD